MLISPESYKTARLRTKQRICNGTGAAGTPKWLVRILDSCNGYGIDFSPASNIHDWMYHWCVHWYHKIYADFIFLLNMIILCVAQCFKKPFANMLGSLIILPLRLMRAFIYFLAVFIFGWLVFYYGKPVTKKRKRQP